MLIAPALRSDVGEAAWYNRASRIPLIGPLITRVFVPILGPRQIDSGLETTFAPQPVPEDYAETVRINRLFNPSVFKANAADMAPVNEHLAAQEVLRKLRGVRTDTEYLEWQELKRRRGSTRRMIFAAMAAVTASVAIAAGLIWVLNGENRFRTATLEKQAQP